MTLNISPYDDDKYEPDPTYLISTDITLQDERDRLSKELLDIETMIKWNNFLDRIEDRPRKVIVIYGIKLKEK